MNTKYSKFNVKRYPGRASSPKTPIKASIGGFLALVLLCVVLLRTEETHTLFSSSTLSSLSSLFISTEYNAIENQHNPNGVSRHLLQSSNRFNRNSKDADVEVSLYNLFKYFIFNQNFTKTD